MPEQTMLICKLVNSPGYVVPGALPMKCHECDKSVWISPSSMLWLHDNPEMQIRCMPCAFAHIATHGGAVEDLTPAQLEEIEEYLKASGTLR